MQTKPKFPPAVPSLAEYLLHQGKVRDTYRLEDPELLLMVATDRISTHDVVHESIVPLKGQILTAMTVFWWREVFEGIPTHLVAFGKKVYDCLSYDQSYPISYQMDLHLRALVVRRLDVVPYELICRGRMSGSLWKKFYSQGRENPYGLALPPGLQLMSPLDPPIFTPTEKSETDDPVLADMVRQQHPAAVALAERAYQQGREYALARGISIIDTKSEVGVGADGNLYLGDEWLTGDCSRFVRSDDIQIGVEPPWMDKEVFRQDAVRQWGGKTTGNPLVFPDEVVKAGMRAYHEVFETLAGSSLEAYQAQHF